MVVMPALIEFEHRMAAFEMMAPDQAGGFELSQHPVHGRQADLFARLLQCPKNLLGGQVHAILLLQHVENLHARQRDFQARLLEFF